MHGDHDGDVRRAQGLGHRRGEVDVDYEPAQRGSPTEFEMTVQLPKELPEEQRERLMQIAAKCPVHRTLEGEVMFDERSSCELAARTPARAPRRPAPRSPGAVRVAGLDVDAAHAVGVDRHARSPRAGRRARCSSRSSRWPGPTTVTLVDAALAQELARARSLERRVALGARAPALVDHDVDARAVEGRVQLGALGALHAVHAATARPARRRSRGRAGASRAWPPRARTGRGRELVQALGDLVAARARASAPPGVKSFWKSTMTSASATPR